MLNRETQKVPEVRNPRPWFWYCLFSGIWVSRLYGFGVEAVWGLKDSCCLFLFKLRGGFLVSRVLGLKAWGRVGLRGPQFGGCEG